MDSGTQWTIVVLFLLLVLLIILLFSKTPFLGLFTTQQRWKKLDEHSGILEHWTGSTTSVPIRNHQAFDKGAALCCSNPHDDFIRMNYGIQDEKDFNQRLGETENMHAQQLLDALPDVHVLPEQNLSSEQLQCTLQLRRCTSTDSLDSAASSITGVAKVVPMVKLTLKYDYTTQMFSSQLHHLTDVYTDYGQIWLLFFLLPHPKPLWRTEARTTPSSFIDYNVIYQQCVRERDLHKHNLRSTLTLSFIDRSAHPAFLKSEPIGKFSSTGQDSIEAAFIRLYIVQPMGQVIKKKTSERLLVDGGADIGETMFFTISRSRVAKIHLRLSIVCESEEVRKSIGHVTLGPKSSGKELGHWQRALSGEGRPLMSWHTIRPRSTV